MKRTIIFINKNHFIFNDQEYDFDRINEINHLFKQNMKIIILEENLYVKQFTDKVKSRKINEFINYRINNEFPQTGDLLYDFEKKNNIIAIYSLKGARRVECLCRAAKNLEVTPIQFIIKEIILRVLKKNKFNVLTKYKDCYYLTCFKDGLFNFGFVNENKESIVREIIENNDLDEIYADDDIAGILDANAKLKMKKLNLGELINEKIYEKQKFYSR